MATPSPLPTAPPPPPAPAAHDLEACAHTLVDQLPRHIADYVREVAYVYCRQPLWSVVAGHVLGAYENGSLQAPILDPSWPRRFPGVGLDLSTTQYQCEHCHRPFTPTRYKQRYCGQVCGAEAAKGLDAAAVMPRGVA